MMTIEQVYVEAMNLPELNAETKPEYMALFHRYGPADLTRIVEAHRIITFVFRDYKGHTL